MSQETTQTYITKSGKKVGLTEQFLLDANRVMTISIVKDEKINELGGLNLQRNNVELFGHKDSKDTKDIEENKEKLDCIIDFLGTPQAELVLKFITQLSNGLMGSQLNNQVFTDHPQYGISPIDDHYPYFINKDSEGNVIRLENCQSLILLLYVITIIKGWVRYSVSEKS